MFPCRFSFSTLFNSHRENVESHLGRTVLIVWLFVVLIITSSYTASLTSILTVQELSPTINGIDSLTGSNAPIGYPAGSFIKNYLMEEFNIDESRLISVDSSESYAKALSRGPSKGGVAAIVDTLPVIQLFLSTQCSFSMVGPEFTKGGWGFGFPKGSQLAIDMSTAILTLSETGDLQRIHDKWLSQNACSSQANEVDATQLRLRSFRGLFLICGVASIAALVAFLGRTIWQFIRIGERSDSFSQRVSSFLNFIDQKETKKDPKDISETSPRRT